VRKNVSSVLYLAPLREVLIRSTGDDFMVECLSLGYLTVDIAV